MFFRKFRGRDDYFLFLNRCIRKAEKIIKRKVHNYFFLNHHANTQKLKIKFYGTRAHQPTAAEAAVHTIEIRRRRSTSSSVSVAGLENFIF